MSRIASKHQLEDLRAVPLFAASSDKELASIARLGDQVSIPAGQIVVRQGAFGQEFYVLLSGTATVEISGEPVAELQAGSYFGEFAPIDHSPRSATVTAHTDSTLMVFGPREFSSLLSEHPSINRRLLADFTRRLRATA
jgi:CRP/FNR family transcriptional regulator, cyclic AMP receptor protein